MLSPTGTAPNITRNALVNCTELVTYDLIKDALLSYKLMSGEFLDIYTAQPAQFKRITKLSGVAARGLC